MRDRNRKQDLVLIVDREFAIGPDLTSQLAARGFEVLYRNNLPEAKDLIKTSDPKIIIVEAAHASELLEKEHISERKEGFLVLDHKMSMLCFFEKQFLSQNLAQYVGDYLKRLNQ